MRARTFLLMGVMAFCAGSSPAFAEPEAGATVAPPEPATRSLSIATAPQSPAVAPPAALQAAAPAAAANSAPSPAAPATEAPTARVADIAKPDEPKQKPAALARTRPAPVVAKRPAARAAARPAHERPVSAQTAASGGPRIAYAPPLPRTVSLVIGIYY